MAEASLQLEVFRIRLILCQTEIWKEVALVGDAKVEMVI